MVFAAPENDPENNLKGNALERFKQLISNKLFASMIGSPGEEDM